MDKIFLFIFAAIAVEGIIYYVKTAFDGNLPKSCMASIILGVFAAVNFRLDVFYYVSLQSTLPFAGNILTGILLSRGSNYMFELVGSLNGNSL